MSTNEITKADDATKPDATPGASATDASATPDAPTDRAARVRELRQKFIAHIHAALKQAFTIETFGPETTVVTIVHKDSPLFPEEAREYCEENGQDHVVMCGSRAMVAEQIRKIPGRNGRPLFEKTSEILSKPPKKGYVYVVTFEENWGSVTPILWSDTPPT